MAVQNITLDMYLENFNEWLDVNEIGFYLTLEKLTHCMGKVSYPRNGKTFLLNLAKLVPNKGKTTLEVELLGNSEGTPVVKKWVLSVNRKTVKITSETHTSNGQRLLSPRVVSYPIGKFTYEKFVDIWGW